MYQSFIIRNFRGFRELHLPALSRITLITGKNNVGKTAVLEAMFLHAGRHNSDLPARVEAIRGPSVFPLHPKGIWGWLFRDRNMDRAIELVGVHEGQRPCTLTISLASNPSASPMAFDLPGSLSAAQDEHAGGDLLLEYKTPEGELRNARAHIEKETVRTELAERMPDQPCIYLSPRSRADLDTAERFSKADNIGGIPDIVDILRHVDSRLQRLSLGFEARQPVVKCDLGMEELVPIHIMGEGMNRLLQLVLAIYDCPGGMVLIDEVENGLEQSALPGIWKAIAYVARKRNVGVVATTHSWHCVQAAFTALEKDRDNDVCLYRLERAADDVRALHYDSRTWPRAFR